MTMTTTTVPPARAASHHPRPGVRADSTEAGAFHGRQAGGTMHGEEGTMDEATWLACADPQRMLEFLRGRAGERKLRLFVRRVA